MKTLIFLLVSIVFLTGITPQKISAQKKSLWISPKTGVWKVSAKDEENVIWKGQLTFTGKTRLKSAIRYKGYFSWISDDSETSGREFFTGLFNRKTGELFLKAHSVKNERGTLGIGNYVAKVSRKGRKISRGNWSGENIVKGFWTADWIKFR